MAVFWIVAAASMAVALLFVVLPLLGSNKSIKGSTRDAQEKLEALKLLETLGRISPEDANSKRDAISATLLEALSGTRQPLQRASYKTASLLAITLVFAAVGIYQYTGNPLALNQEALKPLIQAATDPAAPESPHNQADMERAITELRSKLTETPKDLQGWLLLARSYNSVQQFDAQLESTTKAFALAPQDPEVMIEHAEALALAKYDRQLSGEPEKLLAAALVINPGAQKAMWLTGIAAVQRGEEAAALEIWQRLKVLLEPGSSVAQSLDEQMQRARATLEGPQAPPAQTVEEPAGSEPSTTAPAAADPAAPASITVTIDISPELKAKLKPTDVLFVFARAENGPPMPLSIKRSGLGEFPVTVTLDDSSSMLPTMKLSLFERVIVGARISHSGNAIAASGDFQALSSGFSHREQSNIKLTIAEIVP